MGRRDRSRSRSRDHKKKDRKDKDRKTDDRRHHNTNNDVSKDRRTDRDRSDRFDNRRDDRNNDRNNNERNMPDRNNNDRNMNERRGGNDNRRGGGNDNRRNDNHNRTDIVQQNMARGNKDEIYSKLMDFPIKSKGGFNRWSDGPAENVNEEELKLKENLGADINDPLSTLQKEQSKLFQNVLEGEDESIKKQQFMPPMQLGHDMSLKPRHDKDMKSRTGFSNFGNNSFSYAQGCNPNIINTLNDLSKIKRKIYMPKTNKFNYTGLIIGPKGSNQKRLEDETGCKILVRGRGSQKEGQPPQPDDNEDLHVLVAGENEMQVVRACEEIEKIIFADEDARNNIRQQQLKIVAHIKNSDPLMTSLTEQTTDEVDLSLTTPYGPPSHDAFVIAVPKDCVGLVIGRFGETIRRLQLESGAQKVQVAADNKPGSDFRNVFVEGNEDACEKVKAMLNEIVEQQQRIKAAMGGTSISSQTQEKNLYGVSNNEQKIVVKVPNSMIGLVIGKNGETLKQIYDKTGATVFMPKDEDHPDSNEKTLICSGSAEQTEAAREEIEAIVSQKNLTVKYWRVQGDQPLDLHSNVNNMEYSIPNSVQQIPGFEKLHEIQPLINPNYYHETSVVTETEYYPDGSVKTNQVRDNTDYSSMLIQQSHAMLQASPLGTAMDPNMMGGMHQQGYVDPALYQSYLQNYYTQLQMQGYANTMPPNMEQMQFPNINNGEHNNQQR